MLVRCEEGRCGGCRRLHPKQGRWGWAGSGRTTRPLASRTHAMVFHLPGDLHLSRGRLQLLYRCLDKYIYIRSSIAAGGGNMWPVWKDPPVAR